MRDRTRDCGVKREALLLALALAAGLPPAGAAPAAEVACDADLERDSDSPMAYGPREDRCEGLYRLKVNSDEILIKSWTAWFEDFDPADPRPLELSWRLPSGVNGPVHVRATALKPRTFYRMDTRRAASESLWAWPTRLLGQLRLGRQDLGLVSWAAMAPADDDEPVYLPLTVRQSAAAEPSGYRVALVPGERLIEVSWTVLPVLEGGSVERSASSAEPLGFGYYPAGMPTVFTVPAPLRAGIYVLVLQAQLRSGGEAVRELWFYHPGGDGGTAGGGGAP